MNDTELLDAIERHEGWLTFAAIHAGTPQAWRCYIEGRHFASPDIRERSERMGFGATAREAIRAAIEGLK